MSSPPPADLPPSTPKPASFAQIVGAVFWSFLGVRKGSAMTRDLGNIKPLHVILVGVLLAAILVVCLIGVVRVIVRAAA